jgi:deoxyribodipyrimidine photo-lyase
VRAIHWFRNDLRLSDNAALCEAAAADALLAVFVLDPRLLRANRAAGPRLRFLLDCLARLARELEARGSRLVIARGAPERELVRLAREVGATLVCWNRDYTPFARRRDAVVRAALERLGARVVECADRVVFDDVRKDDGSAYAVYTPFRRAWLRRLDDDPRPPRPAPRLPPTPEGVASIPLPAASELVAAQEPCELPTGGERAAARRLAAFLGERAKDYARLRDLPAVDGTSRLSPYLRFGAISIRTCLEQARELARADPAARTGARKWIDELVWREFYAAIVAAHPRVLRGAFRPALEALRWNDDPRGFAAWQQGRTGYPIVDAGMRQLLATGWMHNRVRMIAASFLVKDLLVDWRRGERHFFERLVDGDPASNNGGWQWSAGTGTDAQPFFRIFNPTAQGERFDPDGDYVRRWVPELRALAGRAVHRPWDARLATPGYPAPIVDHAERRALALERFRAIRRREP